MKWKEQLSDLHRRQWRYYDAFCRGQIGEDEYLVRVCPLDRQIDRIETKSLGNMVWKTYTGEDVGCISSR